MPATYTTQQGDMLDWICWAHYGQFNRLNNAARQMGPGVTDANGPLQDGLRSLSQAGAIDMQGIVEKVLDVNPRLAFYGPVLPANIEIILPEITASDVDVQVVQLWDD